MQHQFNFSEIYDNVVELGIKCYEMINHEGGAARNNVSSSKDKWQGWSSFQESKRVEDMLKSCAYAQVEKLLVNHRTKENISVPISAKKVTVNLPAIKKRNGVIHLANVVIPNALAERNTSENTGECSYEKNINFFNSKAAKAAVQSSFMTISSKKL